MDPLGKFPLAPSDLFWEQWGSRSSPYPTVDIVYQRSATNRVGDNVFQDLFLDDMWVCRLLALCAILTRHLRIQANKWVSRYRLAWDINVLQNLRGLLEHGVQVDLDREENITGNQAEMIEGPLGYASSVGTMLWHEIEEDQSKVCCPPGRSLFYLVADEVPDV
jgi:hypothetical protein